VTSKLAAILMAFTNGRDYTLSELAMQTNLAISTVHRLLNDLVSASLLERPDVRSRATSLVELLEMKMMAARTPSVSHVAH
jgi:DNA-binding IclR family transcriptional regulator